MRWYEVDLPDRSVQKEIYIRIIVLIYRIIIAVIHVLN